MGYSTALTRVLSTFLFLLVNTSRAAETRVVVVSLSNSGNFSQKKVLYLPASSFRPLLGATAWAFEEEAAMINPGMNRTYWIAHLLLPVNSIITAFELL